jgi:CheY-like chemotaxis protein
MEEDEETFCMKNGMDHYLTKPFHQNAINLAITKALAWTEDSLKS